MMLRPVEAVQDSIQLKSTCSWTGPELR